MASHLILSSQFEDMSRTFPTKMQGDGCALMMADPLSVVWQGCCPHLYRYLLAILQVTPSAWVRGIHPVYFMVTRQQSEPSSFLSLMPLSSVTASFGNSLWHGSSAMWMPIAMNRFQSQICKMPENCTSVQQS